MTFSVKTDIMAGSAENIRSYIRQWSLDLVKPSATSIPNGCILHALLLVGGKSRTAACKLLEERLGFSLDGSLFRSYTSKDAGLLKLQKKQFVRPNDDKLWQKFKICCGLHWEVKRQREVIPAKKRCVSAPAPPTDPTYIKQRLRFECGECVNHKAEILRLNQELSQLKAKVKQMEEEKVEFFKVKEESNKVKEELQDSHTS